MRHGYVIPKLSYCREKHAPVTRYYSRFTKQEHYGEIYHKSDFSDFNKFSSHKFSHINRYYVTVIIFIRDKKN